MSTPNPYAAPKAAVADETVINNADFVPGGMGRPAARGWAWIADGWELFKRQPGMWIGIVLLLAVIFIGTALIPFLGGLVGPLLGPVFVVTPTMGDLASLKAFAIVILGGLGSIPGATIGGFILAFMEELGAGYVSSGYRDAMGFLLIIVILLLKPTGLFAQKERIG